MLQCFCSFSIDIKSQFCTYPKTLRPTAPGTLWQILEPNVARKVKNEIKLS